MKSTVFKYLLAVACAFGASVATAQLQDRWPSRPIHWVVPYPAGGTVDQVARLLAEKARTSLGQSIIVENRPGASGMIGAGVVAKSAGDGYTWGFAFDHHVVNPLLMPNMPFDTRKDFQPVILLARLPMVIVAHQAQPYQAFTDVVAAAKAKPDTISFASTGSGSLAHLMMTLLQVENGFRLVHVPYKGGPPAVQDLIAGHVPLYAASPVLVLQHIRAGRVRALAYTGAERSPLLPDVATLSEQGFRGFQAHSFIGIVAPTGVPRATLDRLHGVVTSALAAPDIREKLSGLGMEIAGGTPEGFGDYLNQETDRWGKVVRDNGIRQE